MPSSTCHSRPPRARPTSPDRRRATGRRGEEIAVEHLASRGYRIVDLNWRTRFGELDIVARQGDTLVFVEVRTRATGGFGTAGESVGPAKQRQLRRMAEQYLQLRAPSASARIDVVTVRLLPGVPPQVDHLVGAV